MIGAKLKLKLDVAGVMDRVEKKRNRVLYQTGAYGLTVMKRSIRPPKSGKKARTVSVDGREYFVPVSGKVLDAKTKQPVSKQQADAARKAMLKRLHGEGAGKPPRRGPSDKLRRGMHFKVDEATETVVIGAMPFATKPRLSGAVSIPELLTKGGGEYIHNQLVKFEPHPFVQPAMEITQKRMAELLVKTPL